MCGWRTRRTIQLSHARAVSVSLLPSLALLALLNAVGAECTLDVAVCGRLYRRCADVCRTHIFREHTSANGESNEQIKFCSTRPASVEFVV